MIYDKILKLPYQIINKFFQNKDIEDKRRLINGVKKLIKINELFEINENENNITPYSNNNYYEENYVYEYIEYSPESLNKTNYTSIEENDNYENYNEIEMELINRIYNELIEIEYYPGNTNYQREYAFNQINELIFKD